MAALKSYPEHRAQLATFGQRIAEEQGVEVELQEEVDWAEYGAACRQALAKGRNVPLLVDFSKESRESRPKSAADDDSEPPAVTRRRRGPDASAGTALASLRNELVEVRRRLTHYAREATELELRLERVDGEQQRAYRRSQELVEAIETEELEELKRESVAIAQSHRSLRPGQREEEVLAVLARHPDDDVAPAVLAAALHITPGYVYLLLSKMLKKGLVRRTGLGLYRAARQ